jgi:hypothetical protein
VSSSRKLGRKLAEYKLKHGCADCGFNDDPDALTFDHRDERTLSFRISQRAGRSAGVVWAEVDKCAVRCANCHAKRTAARNRLRNEGKLPPVGR